MTPVIRPLLCLLAAAEMLRAAVAYLPSSVTPPSPAREFRGAWVATVHNIDWPSRPGLPVSLQQAELIALLDRAQQLGLNVFVFQVRPACDALYASKLEPWSEYLSGIMGKGPRPFWDPLEFAVAEAHKRGLELHAWFNPFRARHTTGFSAISRDHISRTRPALVKGYAKSLWLDPGLAEVHDYSMRVILDVVKRYDIDGIHIDDYFYPYLEKDAAGKVLPFPDWTSWGNYVKSGGKLSHNDWRRDNVNRFVARMYREVKQAKPWLKVGISPFGIYRPGFPTQIKGFDQYESIYADPRAWLANGSLDYLAPQLYWRIDPPAQSFPALLKWWSENNPKHRMIVAGLNTTAVGGIDNSAWPASEISRQISLSREQPGASGHIHWNMSALMRNKGGISDDLARNVYQKLALVPAMLEVNGGGNKAEGGKRKAETSPNVSVRTQRGTLVVEWSGDSAASLWLVQTRKGGEWQTEILPRHARSARIQRESPEVISVRSVDRFGNLSSAAVLQPGQPAATKRKE